MGQVRKKPRRRSAARVAQPPAPVGLPQRLRAEHPDPEAAALLKLYNAVAAKPLQHLNLHQARRSWKLMAAAMARAPAVASVETVCVPGPAGPLVLRLYRPAPAGSAASPAFVWFHGGGFLMGGVDTADTICRHVARASGAVVIAAPYRLVPEHPLQEGRADALAAMQGLLERAQALGIDPCRWAVGGDSAGGNLAAVVAQRWQHAGGPPLRLQVLAYPATNLRDDAPSKAENAHGYMLTAASIDWFKTMFSRDAPDLSDPLLSPMFAADVSGVAPALVISAGFDPIRDDGLAYAARLRAAGVPVELLHYAGEFHGFLNFDAVLRGARDALDRIGAALRVAFGGEPAPDRTLELAMHARTTLAGAWMVGERVEQLWGRMLRAWVPGAWPAGFGEHPLLNPVGSTRAVLAAHFVPLVAVETYRGGKP